jgi:hypothetical protein
MIVLRVLFWSLVSKALACIDLNSTADLADTEIVVNQESDQKEYTEGLPDDLWNVNSLYKVNVIAKRHFTNYHRGIHSYLGAKNKLNNLIDM